MSKGDTPRPRSVSQQEYNFRWDYAFGRIPPLSEEAFKRKIEEIRRGSTNPSTKA